VKINREISLMAMFLTIFLAFCLSGFAASSPYYEIHSTVRPEPVDLEDTNCGCSKEPLPQCGCRVDFEINGKQYILESNMTYIKEDNGLQYTVVLNDMVLYNKTFTAKPPSPICLGVCPQSCLCIDYYNISYGEDDKWGGCTEIYADVGVRLFYLKLGCLYLPMNQEEEKNIDKSLLLQIMQQRVQQMSYRRLKKQNLFDVLFKNGLEEDNQENDIIVFH